MNVSKAKTKKESKEREYIEVRSAAVSNVRVIDGKSGGSLIFFTLCINGVYVNNCRVVEGKSGDFISFPQYKGSNGQYYNTVYCAISDEDTKKILDQVQAEIDA